MPEEKKPQKMSLTDLTTAAHHLVGELVRHTVGRHYLYQTLTEEGMAPVITISEQPTFSEEVPEKEPQAISINSMGLPSDSTELILTALIEHEEKLAFHCWEQLKEVTSQACEVIGQMMKAREQQKEEDFRPTLPFPNKQISPPSLGDNA